MPIILSTYVDRFSPYVDNDNKCSNPRNPKIRMSQHQWVMDRFNS
jgi:hypothetical protein